MRPLVVVPVDKCIEARLLLEHIRTGGFGGGFFEGEMHPLMPILLGMPGLDAFEANAESQPPHGEFAEPIERSRPGEGNAVVGADGERKSKFLEDAFEDGNAKVPCVFDNASHASR